jgi:hypothetical protein
METLIRQNLTKLCHKTKVYKSLIDELYSKEVMNSELKQKLVRQHMIK